MATGKKNAVAAPKQTAVSADVIDYSADLGAGMEQVSADSFAIPFLGALQKISPQCDESDPKYIEGAKGGQLFNSVTQELFDGKKGVRFIMSYYKRVFIKWGPRGESNAGFKGEFAPEVIAGMREQGVIKELDGRLYEPLSDGTVNEKKCNRYADVRNHFGILISAKGVPQEVLLSLGSTQIRKSKLLMSQLSALKSDEGKTLPTFASGITITTIPESNDKGNWFGLLFQIDEKANTKEYAAARAFYQTVSAGQVKVNYDAQGGEQREGF